jgi:hypothetical protein
MKNAVSRNVTLVFHHDLPFIALRYSYVTLTSSPQFTSPYLTSLHFIALNFFMISTTTPSHLIYHFPNHELQEANKSGNHSKPHA